MRLLCICTGNICRSPTAEILLRHHASLKPATAHFHIDSAGTHRYHIGEAPDPRTQKVALAQGHDMSSLRARQVSKEDFEEYDLLLAMDSDHAAWLKNQASPTHHPKIQLFLPFAGLAHPKDVPDPYYGSMRDFEEVFELINTASAQLIMTLAIVVKG